ncbi:V-set domain-containing T-cell activation inhibitor 1-like isoform X4 [Melanotaenia boesemani]|nr:V-set domain-containing T-cell activation inhibitor 1-like isoform X4 [Melanotaenia boesemani]XP_041834386.1 V-set domain-containing T-cell activation inhibitor 1-like isoform X4 [Melanotaenia boesemani]XP_041834387.1 V-set domain-containing T-cell activation inhibitor 1-like isoform X4 [Melanotaenia boesemani]
MFLASTVSPVICQDLTVNGTVGRNVLLPCSYNESVLERVNVSWTDQDDAAVLNIRGGREDSTFQDQKYKGRVKSFQEEYKKGNFSIKMKDLKVEDAQKYECFIHKIDHRMFIKLTVSEQPEVEEKMISPSDGAAGRNLVHILLLSALCLLLCF